jgi:excisionase family DNA binding protein
VATPPKISLDDLIAHPERAYGLAGDQVRDTLKQIAERTSALKSLEADILWQHLADRNNQIHNDGFPRLLNAKQLAEHLALPESWVREQARIGELPSIKLGHYVRFRLDDVQAYIASLTHPKSIVGIGSNIFGSTSHIWHRSSDTTNRTVLAELADVSTAWIIVLWGHMVHENGFFSQQKRRLKSIFRKPS